LRLCCFDEYEFDSIVFRRYFLFNKKLETLSDNPVRNHIVIILDCSGEKIILLDTNVLICYIITVLIMK